MRNTEIQMHCEPIGTQTSLATLQGEVRQTAFVPLHLCIHLKKVLN